MRSEVKNQINKCRKPRQGNQRQWQNGLSQTAFKNKSYKFRIKSKLLTMVYKILYDLALACHFPSPSFISSLPGQTDSSPPFHKVLFVFFVVVFLMLNFSFLAFGILFLSDLNFSVPAQREIPNIKQPLVSLAHHPILILSIAITTSWCTYLSTHLPPKMQSLKEQRSCLPGSFLYPQHVRQCQTPTVLKYLLNIYIFPNPVGFWSLNFI